MNQIDRIKHYWLFVNHDNVDIMSFLWWVFTIMRALLWVYPNTCNRDFHIGTPQKVHKANCFSWELAIGDLSGMIGVYLFFTCPTFFSFVLSMQIKLVFLCTCAQFVELLGIPWSLFEKLVITCQIHHRRSVFLDVGELKDTMAFQNNGPIVVLIPRGDWWHRLRKSAPVKRPIRRVKGVIAVGPNLAMWGWRPSK